MRGYRAAGSMLNTSWALALKAECLHLAIRPSEALTAIEEAETIVASSGERWWQAELHRLRGVVLTAMDSDQAHIELLLGEAIRNRKGTEIHFTGETRGRNLRRIPKAKSELIRRTWISPTSLLNATRKLQIANKFSLPYYYLT